MTTKTEKPVDEQLIEAFQKTLKLFLCKVATSGSATQMALFNMMLNACSGIMAASVCQEFSDKLTFDQFMKHTNRIEFSAKQAMIFTGNTIRTENGLESSFDDIVKAIQEGRK